MALDMTFNEMLNNVLYILIVCILPVLTRYGIRIAKAKIREINIIKETTQNENMSNIVKDALSDVMDAVLYVNQIYTDSLKANGKFDKTAQEEAFNRAYIEAMNMISNEAKKVINQLYGSFDKWLQLKIESAVNAAKNNNA
ncbi:MAG: hypothetical protein J1D87_04155 [Lachnospiraceae bacterium]|nr:hypothetical protein [Lachnospiraceae bacterium]